jgi:hypothetical protein
VAELWLPASIPVLRDGDQVIGETSITVAHVSRGPGQLTSTVTTNPVELVVRCERPKGTGAHA